MNHPTTRHTLAAIVIATFPTIATAAVIADWTDPAAGDYRAVSVTQVSYIGRSTNDGERYLVREGSISLREILENPQYLSHAKRSAESVVVGHVAESISALNLAIDDVQHANVMREFLPLDADPVTGEILSVGIWIAEPEWITHPHLAPEMDTTRFNRRGGHVEPYTDWDQPVLVNWYELPIDLATATNDFDRDGAFTSDDMDLLSPASMDYRGEYVPGADFYGNGSLEESDRRAWYRYGIVTTQAGDANVDGLFNSADLVQVLAAGKYEVVAPFADSLALWSEGDWNFDHVFNSRDLIAALATGTYETPAAAAAVPEPSATLLLLSIGPVIGRLRRRGCGRVRADQT